MSLTHAPISRMRHRVTLQEPVRAPDGMGGYTVTWTDRSTVWARVQPMDPQWQARFAAAQSVYNATHLVTIRHYPTLDRTWRVLHGTLPLYVRMIEDVEAQEAVQVLACSTVEPDVKAGA